MPKRAYKKKRTKKAAPKGKPKRTVDPVPVLRRVREAILDFLDTPEFWTQGEETAFVNIMKKRTSIAPFAEPVDLDESEPLRAPLPTRGDAFAGLFNRSDTDVTVSLTLWQTVPGAYESYPLIVPARGVAFFWDGAFPLITSTTAHAYPVITRGNDTDWSDLFWIGTYVDIDTRWTLAAQSQRFPYGLGYVQYGRGMVLVCSEEAGDVSMKDTETIVYDPMRWANGPVLMRIRVDLSVETEDHVRVACLPVQIFTLSSEAT